MVFGRGQGQLWGVIPNFRGISTCDHKIGKQPQLALVLCVTGRYHRH